MTARNSTRSLFDRGATSKKIIHDEFEDESRENRLHRVGGVGGDEDHQAL